LSPENLNGTAQVEVLREGVKIILKRIEVVGIGFIWYKRRSNN
jgi:hypothetical protein